MGNQNARWSEASDVIPMFPTLVWKIELEAQLRDAIGARVLAALAHLRRDPRGRCFQTKSLPDPCMCRYRITSAGRLIDPAGNDLEPDGYINFYTVDRENGDNEVPGK